MYLITDEQLSNDGSLFLKMVKSIVCRSSYNRQSINKCTFDSIAFRLHMVYKHSSNGLFGLLYLPVSMAKGNVPHLNLQSTFLLYSGIVSFR